ncbi:MAG TPA: hypothetical protein VHW44_24165 [Pseudonocardiaceae bacterium]|jgi:hypothetical protein|nr:hypothetical protein [Pseudonocardiaceae bacterium]
MIQDPLTVWNGPYPYDALAPAGVTPAYSHAQMAEVSFTLMTRRMMNPRTQKAWNELRDLQRRLLADFLLYDVDAAEEIADARAELAREFAAPTETPEAVRALAMPVEALTELTGELAEVVLDSAPPVSGQPLFGVFPPPSLIDSLIEFDR